MELKTTNVFLWNYKSKKRIKINRGWTRSGKTYNLLKLFVVWILTGQINEEEYILKWVLSIVRKYNATLSKTVERDLNEIIDEMWVRDLININKTEKTYKYDWRIIELFWADDQQKLRGWKRDILYCNEANELNYQGEFFQLNVRTSGFVFIDFNPDDEDVWINRELEQKRALTEWDVDIFISTYKDNPFLSDVQIKEIEYIEKIDPMLWEVYWKWEYWKIEWLIFEMWVAWDIKKSIPKDAEYIGSWMDFWFTNDPTTLTDIYRFDWELYFDEMIYETWMTNQDIWNRIKNLEQHTWFKRDIIADSAEPKSIEELSRMWIKIKWAVKWKDSINYWISLMKGFKINITQRSINIIKEFRKYIWKVTRDGKSLNIPIDEFNHSIDWIRYLVMWKLWNKKNPSIFIG